MLLVRVETSPEDIHGMHAAGGILTSRGGMTSHAAVVARGMGKPCALGGAAISRSTIAAPAQHRYDRGRRRRGAHVDGSRGEVILGAVPTVDPKLSAILSR